MIEYNIQELADKVNELLKKEEKLLSSLKDSRINLELSERRVRDYMTKGLLEKPLQEGNKKWFNEKHVDQLLSIRKLQLQGISESVIKEQLLLGNQSIEENNNKEDALNLLNSLSSSSQQQESSYSMNIFASTSQKLQPQFSSLASSGRDLLSTQSAILEQKYKSYENTRKAKTIEEFDILEKGMIQIRFSSQISHETKEDILKYIENKLNQNN